MRKNSFWGIVLFSLFYALPVKAVCPVCTIAVGAGVGLAQYLGIEDTITGVWIGGLVISMAFWTDNWIVGRWKKNINFQKYLLVVAYFAVVVWPLYWQGIIGHTANTLCGIDKLLFGILAGAAGFWIGSELHLMLKKRNGDKVYFPFQKVAFGLAPLIISSIIFYIVSKC